MIEAAFADDLSGNAVRCRLCPHDCEIAPDSQGRCSVRFNLGGVLYSANYQECHGLSVIPVECIPLFHAFPGCRALAVASEGANLIDEDSLFEEPTPSRWLSSGEVVDMAPSMGTRAIAFVGAEPLMWYEFVLETAQAARSSGISVLLATAGYIRNAPLAELLPLLTAVVIELYGVRNAPYIHRFGHPAPEVLATAIAARRACRLEIVYHVLPGVNDTPAELLAFVDWMQGDVGDVPVHLRATPFGGGPSSPAGAFVPRSAPPVAALVEAYQVLSKALPFVYLDDIPSEEGRNTRCPCGALLVEREDVRSRLVSLDAEGFCSRCGRSAHIRV